MQILKLIYRKKPIIECNFSRYQYLKDQYHGCLIFQSISHKITTTKRIFIWRNFVAFFYYSTYYLNIRHKLLPGQINKYPLQTKHPRFLLKNAKCAWRPQNQFIKFVTTEKKKNEKNSGLFFLESIIFYCVYV